MMLPDIIQKIHNVQRLRQILQVFAGIVVNNGIVLVDYVNQLKAKGLSKDEA